MPGPGGSSLALRAPLLPIPYGSLSLLSLMPCEPSICCLCCSLKCFFHMKGCDADFYIFFITFFFLKIPLRVLLLSQWIGSSIAVISPLGLPVPKKVTARKQNPSASPGSGNFRDTLFNILRAQPPPRASAAAQVGHSTSHSKVLAWAGTRFFGGRSREGKGRRGQLSCLREGDVGATLWSLLHSQGGGSGLGEPGWSCRASRALLRFPGNGNIPLFIFLLPLPSPLRRERCRV